MNLKFLRYDPVQNEKHVGIATIRIEEGIRIILRFKVTPKDGGGYYYQPAPVKVPGHGKDNYFPSFALDSSYENDEMKEFLAVHVEPMIQQQNASVFNQPPQARPAYVAQPAQQQNPNYQGYGQPQAPIQQNQYRQDRPQQQQNYQNGPEEQLPF